MSSVTDLSHLPAYPAPAGLKTDFNSSNNHIVGSYVLHTIVLLFTTIAVAVRLYTRKMIKNFIGCDDHAIFASWVLTITFSTLLIIANQNGYGNHIWNIRASQMYKIGQVQFAAQMIYTILLMTIKISILMTYVRIFGSSSKIGALLIYMGIAIITIFYLTCLLLSLLWCRPMAKAWYPILEGSCHPYDVHLVLGTASGVFNILTDFFILVLPIPFVCRLKMSFERKVRLLAVFSLGLSSCICSIPRLCITIKYINDPDQFYYFVKYIALVILEINVGLICSCALVFPAFIEALRDGLSRSGRSKIYGLHYRSRSRLASESGTELQNKGDYNLTISLPGR